jgi:hypothetical protein
MAWSCPMVPIKASPVPAAKTAKPAVAQPARITEPRRELSDSTVCSPAAAAVTGGVTDISCRIRALPGRPLFPKRHPLFSLCYLLLKKLSKSLTPLSDCPFVLNRLPVFLGNLPVFGKTGKSGQASGSRLTFESRDRKAERPASHKPTSASVDHRSPRPPELHRRPQPAKEEAEWAAYDLEGVGSQTATQPKPSTRSDDLARKVVEQVRRGA